MCLDVLFLVCGPCDNIEEQGIIFLENLGQSCTQYWLSYLQNNYHRSIYMGKKTRARQLSLFSQSVQQKGCLEECMGTAASQKGSCV